MGSERESTRDRGKREGGKEGRVRGKGEGGRVSGIEGREEE